MVEANPEAVEQYEEEQKTFIDEPAILDKYKAAALITDSKSLLTRLFAASAQPTRAR